MQSLVDTVPIRDPQHVAQAALGGADIATIPPQVLHPMVARVRTAGPTERSPRPGSSPPLAFTRDGRPAQPMRPRARQS